MRSPQTTGASSGGSWLFVTIEARRRALQAAAIDARAIAAVRLARALVWSGDDGAATRVLIAERRAARRRNVPIEVARCELGLAEIALNVDDEDRAAVHLATAPRKDAAAHDVIAAWIAARRGTQHLLPEAPLDGDAPWVQELADTFALELLWARGSSEGLTVRGGDVRTRTLVDVCTAARERSPDGVQRCLLALERAGLDRDFGRSILRVLAAAPEVLDVVPGAATAWVSRAETALGDAATWRDRVAMRHAWRLHGRRDADRALPRDIAVRLDARDRMHAHVQSTLSVGIDRQMQVADELEVLLDRADTADSARDELGDLRDSIDLLDASASSALGELARVEGDLGRIVASTFAERERARAIAQTLAGMEAATDAESMVAELATVVLDQLAADAVVIAERVPHVGLRAILARGIDPDDERWVGEAEEILDVPIGSRRGTPEPPLSAVAHDRRGGGRNEVPSRPVLAVPMRTSGTDGAIYVDKLASGGTFSSADLSTLELLASYAGLALARLRAINAAAQLGRRLAATIDAMRDGLLAVDSEGIVTAINEPAARLLRVEQARVLGRRLDSVADLVPLAVTLQSGGVDGLVVRLASSSVVVHSRAIAGEGVVATLIEYERAQKMAQKIVGPRARYTFGDLKGNDSSALFGAGPIVPLSEIERRAYIEAYERSHRSVTRAAKALGVSRVTFYGKLRQFGMHPAEVTGEVPSVRPSSSQAATTDPDLIDPSAETLAMPDERESRRPPSRRR